MKKLILTIYYMVLPKKHLLRVTNTDKLTETEIEVAGKVLSRRFPDDFEFEKLCEDVLGK